MRLIALFAALAPCLLAQSAVLRPAPEAKMPGVADSNSPAFWRDGGFYLFNSVALPLRSEGAGQFALGFARSVLFDDYQSVQWRWIEAVWRDEEDGTIYAWYHNEPGLVCDEQPLTAPRIGALYSVDNGLSFFDLGIVLEDGHPPDCESRNGYFAAGHGDFSVIPDREKRFFYFFFSTYGGDVAEQGIAIARMRFQDRRSPGGNVWKYHKGEWTEPGLAGQATPIFPAVVSWASSDSDAFWGPSIHWNTYLEQYVMLMNRSCCEPFWPAEGIYVAFNADLSDPSRWTSPERLLTNAGWYPQVLGLEEGGTDTLAGEVARLYVGGESRWEILFSKTPQAQLARGKKKIAAEPVAAGQRLYRRPRPVSRPPTPTRLRPAPGAL